MSRSGSSRDYPDRYYESRRAEPYGIPNQSRPRDQHVPTSDFSERDYHRYDSPPRRTYYDEPPQPRGRYEENWVRHPAPRAQPDFHPPTYRDHRTPSYTYRERSVPPRDVDPPRSEHYGAYRGPPQSSSPYQGQWHPDRSPVPPPGAHYNNDRDRYGVGYQDFHPGSYDRGTNPSYGLPRDSGNHYPFDYPPTYASMPPPAPPSGQASYARPEDYSQGQVPSRAHVENSNASSSRPTSASKPGLPGLSSEDQAHFDRQIREAVKEHMDNAKPKKRVGNEKKPMPVGGKPSVQKGASDQAKEQSQKPKTQKDRKPKKGKKNKTKKIEEDPVANGNDPTPRDLSHLFPKGVKPTRLNIGTPAAPPISAAAPSAGTSTEQARARPSASEVRPATGTNTEQVKVESSASEIGPVTGATLEKDKDGSRQGGIDPAILNQIVGVVTEVLKSSKGDEVEAESRNPNSELEAQLRQAMANVQDRQNQQQHNINALQSSSQVQNEMLHQKDEEIVRLKAVVQSLLEEPENMEVDEADEQGRKAPVQEPHRPSLSSVREMLMDHCFEKLDTWYKGYIAFGVEAQQAWDIRNPKFNTLWNDYLNICASIRAELPAAEKHWVAKMRGAMYWLRSSSIPYTTALSQLNTWGSNQVGLSRRFPAHYRGRH